MDLLADLVKIALSIAGIAGLVAGTTVLLSRVVAEQTARVVAERSIDQYKAELREGVEKEIESHKAELRRDVDKDIERYRSDLKLAADKEIERVKIDLKTHAEFQQRRQQAYGDVSEIVERAQYLTNNRGNTADELMALVHGLANSRKASYERRRRRNDSGRRRRRRGGDPPLQPILPEAAAGLHG